MTKRPARDPELADPQHRPRYTGVPAFAPGTGTPEAGGMTTIEALRTVRGLMGLDVVGADLVEVSPPFDVGGLTAFNGASILFELLCVTAAARLARA